jgi:hypothetical protein
MKILHEQRRMTSRHIQIKCLAATVFVSTRQSVTLPNSWIRYYDPIYNINDPEIYSQHNHT